MSSLDEEYFDIAVHEAKKSTMEKRHGAVLIYRNKVIGKGHNSFLPTSGHHHTSKHIEEKSHGRFSEHAEVACIRSVHKYNTKYIPESVMLVVRILKKDYGSSAPCPSCHKAILRSKIRRVYYTTD